MATKPTKLAPKKSPRPMDAETGRANATLTRAMGGAAARERQDAEAGRMDAKPKAKVKAKPGMKSSPRPKKNPMY
jgi:hypothetical protein